MAPNRRFVSWTLAVMSALAFVVGASAQQLARVVSQAVVTPDDPIFAPQDPQPPPQQQTAGAGAQRGRGGRGDQPPAPRPYDQVITSAAKTDDGIFKVHRIGDTLCTTRFPKAQLGKDFLWVTQIKKTTIGAGYGGQDAGSRVVRWVHEGRSRPAPEHRLQRRRRSDDARSRRRSTTRTTRRSSARSTSRRSARRAIR